MFLIKVFNLKYSENGDITSPTNYWVHGRHQLLSSCHEVIILVEYLNIFQILQKSSFVKRSQTFCMLQIWMSKNCTVYFIQAFKQSRNKAGYLFEGCYFCAIVGSAKLAKLAKIKYLLNTSCTVCYIISASGIHSYSSRLTGGPLWGIVDRSDIDRAGIHLL